MEVKKCSLCLGQNTIRRGVEIVENQIDKKRANDLEATLGFRVLGEWGI